MTQKRGFEVLQAQVLETERCTGCGACVITCPFKNILDYSQTGPSLIGECTKCGICLRVCPRWELDLGALEQLVFGRERRPDEVFGLSKAIRVARSTQTDLLQAGQDGGVATALLTSALASGAIDGAALSGLDPSFPWRPRPCLATTHGAIVDCAGTRYSYSPNLLAYHMGVVKGLKRIAFVGTPCQIQALRRIQNAALRKHARALAVAIGLFCSESFSYEGLMLQKIQGALELDLTTLTKMNIKGSIILHTATGQTVKIPLREARRYSEAKCQYCQDFSAELADISLGGIGLEGWTLAVIRTDKGEALFNNAVHEGALDVASVDDFESASHLLHKLSTLKRSRVAGVEGVA